MNRSMIEQNTLENEGKKNKLFLSDIISMMIIIRRHNILELIETEKEYVKDLALIVEV